MTAFNSGLVELDAHTVLRKVSKLIEEKEQEWAEEDARQIQGHIAYTAANHWFGIVRGRVITEEEAIKELDADSEMFGWRCYSGGYWQNKRITIQKMCEAAIEEVPVNTAAKVYLSGEQIGLI